MIMIRADSIEELNKGNLVIYTNKNDKIEIEVFFYDETICLLFNKITELFGKDKSVISTHIQNIYNEKRTK